jgi:type I restriction enzyme, S subunit
MADEPPRMRLAELCEQIVDCPHSTPLWTESGVLVLRNQNIRNGRLDLSSPSFTDEHHFEQRSRRARLRAGDLVITREAPMGEVCMIPEDLRCCLGQRMVMLRADPRKCHARFLLYAIQSSTVQHEIKVNEGTGSTVSNLRIPLLEALPIPYPPLPEQRAIASVLGALDDKIDLNRRMCQTLEEMARALFKSWFVDFDPVRAKMEGRDPGLPKEIADLFPSRLVDSDLGPIPEGWRVAAVSEHFNISIGRTPPRKEPEWFSERESDVPWLSIRDLGDASVFAWRTSEFLTAEAVERFRVPIIPAGTVVLSFKLTVGRVAITSRVMLSNEAIAHFLPKHDCPTNTAWMLCYLKQYSFGRLGSTSSIATAVNSESIRTMPVLYPLAEACARFAEIVRPMFDRIQQLDHETRTLAALRDTLLPKLISGELRVPASLGSMQEVATPDSSMEQSR